MKKTKIKERKRNEEEEEEKEEKVAKTFHETFSYNDKYHYCTFAVKTIIAFEMNEANRAKAHTLHFKMV